MGMVKKKGRREGKRRIEKGRGGKKEDRIKVGETPSTAMRLQTGAAIKASAAAETPCVENA